MIPHRIESVAREDARSRSVENGGTWSVARVCDLDPDQAFRPVLSYGVTSDPVSDLVVAFKDGQEIDP